MTLSCCEDGATEACDGSLLAGSAESLEDILARHKKEKKELLGQITAMKKTIPKGNNKQKKQIMEDIARLESELKGRQEQEVADAEVKKTNTEEEDLADESQENDASVVEVASKISKAQKRREKKLEEEKRKNALAKEAAIDALTAPSTREKQAIGRVLAKRNLQICDIVPDGDCLYNALSHQLFNSKTGEQLRQMACEFIQQNKSEFLPFLTTPDGDIVEDGGSFDEYCLKVRLPSREGGVWGGEAELRAISLSLNRKIEVVHADGRVTAFGDQEDENSLVVSYHQHAYSLGEHYNSTEPFKESDDESDC